MVELTLHGHVPSKKNSYRRRGGSGFFVDDQVQADIDALIRQAQAARHALDVKRLYGQKLRVIAEFFVKKEQRDLDNAFTTLLDVLQKALIIDNDKHVRAFGVEEYLHPEREEGVRIVIMPL